MQEEHLGGSDVQGASFGGRHAQQHTRRGRVVLLRKVAVDVRGAEAGQVA